MFVNRVALYKCGGDFFGEHWLFSTRKREKKIILSLLTPKCRLVMWTFPGELIQNPRQVLLPDISFFS